jgi:hypothetical protein
MTYCWHIQYEMNSHNNNDFEEAVSDIESLVSVFHEIKLPQNIPNGHKIYQLLPLQDPPKCYPNWNFRFENIPSGNPDPQVN